MVLNPTLKNAKILNFFKKIFVAYYNSLRLEILIYVVVQRACLVYTKNNQLNYLLFKIEFN